MGELLYQEWKLGKGKERMSKQAQEQAATPMTCRNFNLDSGWNTDQKETLLLWVVEKGAQ